MSAICCREIELLPPPEEERIQLSQSRNHGGPRQTLAATIAFSADAARAAALMPGIRKLFPRR